jgi:hypothetical protein
MGFTKMSLKQMVDYFNKTGKRPYGNLRTLSRYGMSFNADYFYRICQTAEWDIDIDKTDSFINDEVVFRALGFECLDTMDISEYEGAKIIYDLNDTHIPKEMVDKYDFILDGGTIEHMFNLRNVLENISRYSL